MKQAEHMRAFVEEIWKWYQAHKRTLPWRDMWHLDEGERSYRVLVSEVMLQQTQVPRVMGIFQQFIEVFPTIHTLAIASNREVLLAWRGMGYNSRALRLRDAAKCIVEKFGGKFPCDTDDLLSIKGIGEYTAAAIRNFAFNLPTPCLDTNIRRILHRTFVGLERPDGTGERDDRYLLKLAGEVLEIAVNEGNKGNRRKKGRSFSASDWHSALMDFGSLVQTKRNPRWEVCPLTARGVCRAALEPRNRGAHQNVGQRGRREPGRYIGERFVPNRLFRGWIVDALRDAPQGLSFHALGSRVCGDWSLHRHRAWFKTVLKSLQEDLLVSARQGGVYFLEG